MELEQDVIETPEVEEIADADEGLQQNDQVEADESEADGIVVQVGGDEEEEPQGAPEWVRELRRANREKDREIRELRAKVAAQDAPQDEGLPPEPTLEDYDYDEAAFRAGYKEWVKKSAAYEAEQEQFIAKQREFDERWQNRLSSYEEGRAKLGAPDYEDAEAVVTEILAKPFWGMKLADARLSVIKNVADDPNAVVYALGKNEAKAKELAEIDDVTAFAYAVGKLEAKMTIVRGGAKPAPEKKIGNLAAGVGATDNTLERLREEAAKTGDFSKVLVYKKAQRA